MKFSIVCNAKGCGKIQDPYLDPATNKVFCSLCDKEIVNLNFITINQLKSNKQFKQNSNASFSVKCIICKWSGRPKLTANDDVVCGSCNKPLTNITDIFKKMLKDKLKTAKKDI